MWTNLWTRPIVLSIYLNLALLFTFSANSSDSLLSFVNYPLFVNINLQLKLFIKNFCADKCFRFLILRIVKLCWVTFQCFKFTDKSHAYIKDKANMFWLCTHCHVHRLSHAKVKHRQDVYIVPMCPQSHWCNRHVESKILRRRVYCADIFTTTHPLNVVH